MGCNTSKLNLQKQGLYIPVSQWQGWVQGTSEFESAADATVLLAYMSSVGVGSAPITGAVMNADNDVLGHLMLIPTDWNIKRPVNMSIVWTSDSTTDTNTVTWLVAGRATSANSTVDPLDTATTALGSVVDTVVTDYTVQVSDGIDISSELETLSDRNVPGFFHYKVAKSSDVGITNIWLLGVYFEYTLNFGYSQEMQPEGADHVY